ncbi:MAG: ketoacyl-ACP synthase III, partial [Proteobacteria bacterium]|nr:ketoacyl-ACP synthase III [Pseudomonadota bacterium]
MSGMKSVVRGVGAYLPDRVMTNADLAKIVDTSDEWIVDRSGIRQRHIAADGEFTSDLAIAAGRQAIAAAGFDASDIDMVIVATATPDETFPATAVKVQASLGINQGAAFDIQAVCSGFIYGMSIADSMIRAGQSQRLLLIGAETFSRILDWEDRATCVLFGDGAGAVVLEGQEGGERGVLASKLRSDGTKHDLLYVDGGPSSTQTVGHLRMRGPDVFKHAVKNLSSIIENVLEDTGYVTSDIDWVVPHQANKRILDAPGKKLG